MYTVIIFSVGGLILGALAGGLYGKLNELFFGTVIGTFGGWAFGLILGFFTGALFGRTERIVSERVPLVALRTVDAHVFLSGRADENGRISYRVMVENLDGSMTPRTLEAPEQRIKIVEDARLVGRGELVIRINRYDPKHWLTRWVTGAPPEEPAYEYHVPKGTVRNTFDAR
jgi:hypothetical protein